MSVDTESISGVGLYIASDDVRFLVDKFNKPDFTELNTEFKTLGFYQYGSCFTGDIKQCVLIENLMEYIKTGDFTLPLKELNSIFKGIELKDLQEINEVLWY